MVKKREGDEVQSELMRILAEKQERKENIALVTVISSNSPRGCRAGEMMLVDRFGYIIGDGIGDSLLQENAQREAQICISEGISRRVILPSEEGMTEVFINAFCHRDQLIIVGSGNVALNVYRIASIVGYSITVIDNRAETLSRERFPEARELLLGDIVELLKAYDIDENTSIVLLSYHHEFDEAALLTVIHSPARYIGIMGNKHKVTAYFSKLNELNIAEALISRVHVPVGIDIGGERAAEIALAVVAEMQAIKYGRAGGFRILQSEIAGKVERDELF